MKGAPARARPPDFAQSARFRGSAVGDEAPGASLDRFRRQPDRDRGGRGLLCISGIRARARHAGCRHFVLGSSRRTTFCQGACTRWVSEEGHDVITMSTSRRSLRQETRTPPAGSLAKVLDASALELLDAYGMAFQSAVRETYRRCVLFGEPWFVAGRNDAHAGGVRSQLIARGWSLMQTAIEAAVSEFLGRGLPPRTIATAT